MVKYHTLVTSVTGGDPSRNKPTERSEGRRDSPPSRVCRILSCFPERIER